MGADGDHARDDSVAPTRSRLIEELFEDVERCIAEGDLNRALDRMWALGDEVPPVLRKEITLASQSLSDHRSKVVGGTLSYDAEQATRNRLASRLYDLATDLRSHALGLHSSVVVEPLRESQGGENPRAEVRDQSATRVDQHSTGDGPTDVVVVEETPESGDPRLTQEALAFRCENLYWSVAEREILKGISLWGGLGEVVAIVGRNGSGKSSLLRVLSLDRRPSSGVLDYPAARARGLGDSGLRDGIAHLHQQPPRFSGTIGRLLSMYSSLRWEPAPEALAELDTLVERMGLTQHWEDQWSALSGGYRTRFELVRLLLGKPHILLLDEPLAALDPPSQARYIETVRDLARSPRGPAVVITSQHVAEVEAIADMVLVLEAGEVKYWGRPEDIAEVVGRRVFEYSGALDPRALEKVLEPLGSFIVRPRGSAIRLLSHDHVDSRTLLRILVDAGTVQHFSDLSGSALLLLDEAAES